MSKFVLFVETSCFPHYQGHYERDGWVAPFLGDNYNNAYKFNFEAEAREKATRILLKSI